MAIRLSLRSFGRRQNSNSLRTTPQPGVQETSMQQKSIPDIVVSRMPLYLRALQRMSQEGRKVTSSQELGERLGISAAQIRKDLSQFGEFGKQGTGYNIEYLAEQIKSILKVNRVWDVAVVGAGDIGSALANYLGFADRGFRVVMVFDNDPKKIGREAGPFTVKDISNLGQEISSAEIKIAMLAVPAQNAQEVADRLVDAGVKAILNYAPINLTVPDGVRVQYIDPVTHLQRMTYYL
ncbi:MAG: redox-sensing transcriptional repressor Rex [Anaerolineales bacterium]|nr:redox-sensing transcriptional repressor Rex [Anaerolineales bacterium]